MSFSIKNISELEDTAKKILSFAGKERIFVFYGDMGAGKTTFISHLCKALGTEDQPSSPTFSIVNEYHTESFNIYHFDFYRLKSQEEAFDLGYEDYFYSGDYCLIEWPEKIPDLLPDKYIEIRINVLGESSREIFAQKKPQYP
ncbi:tRNA (adenosine(37)-N6)-threonylcarbamoyltransferase complex ATPase subunit type 1 TsaE [Pseudoxanthomonas sp. SGD-10]|nr:tRNA (adenosine(37)-N6)-threonylcarbamoyltransferase complex ATPase subunit type 1 TsaE [Pseudoxanthomonas sp. SGD-10]